AGANPLPFAVPCTAASQAVTYARFRLSTAGGLGATGPAMDGEVEDYELATKGVDLGDAPDSYGTLLASSGPSHAVDPTTPIYLGACVDSEVDGQPVAAGAVSDGDDLGAGLSALGSCAGPDDEDGIVFDDMIVACGTSNLTATVSLSGFLDAWIDFDGDGDFGDADEQIFAGQAVTTGANPLPYSVPCSTSVQTVTYARFRLSTTGNLAATGPAMDGEVEDYEVTTKGVDLGDAPDTYGTTVGVNGARHALDPASPLYLGACVDSEAEGQPAMGGDPAIGDDVGAGLSALGTCAGPDDEDGIVFDDMIVACGTSNLTVTASQSGLLDGWIDFDGDGDFGDSGEQIFTSLSVSGGANPLPYAVPCAVTGQPLTYARFRLSSAGGLSPTGAAADGEVEDYDVVLKGLDFGDAPETAGYPTLLASDGARHIVQPTGNPTLGVLVDSEADGQPDANHLGDDSNNTDDEDGVTFAGTFVPGAANEVTLTTGTTGGLVNAWIDWNGDGDWDDSGEQVLSNLAIAANTSQPVGVTAPVSAAEGTVCARVRIDSQGGLSPTGLATDGEIEDYAVAVGIEEPTIGIAKQLLSAEELSPGEYLVTLQINLQNVGNVALFNVQAQSSLVDTFTDAVSWEVDGVTSVDLTVNPGFDGSGDVNLLSGFDSLDVGTGGVLQVAVIVRPGTFPGPYYCSATVIGTSPAGVNVEDTSQDGDDNDPDDDGDPTNNNDPTVVLFDLAPVEIPTLDVLGLLILVILLLIFGCLRIRWLRRGTRLFKGEILPGLEVPAWEGSELGLRRTDAGEVGTDR
ncbi:MAG: GEVED domain-containing protein, partial [Acidobacteriota bacterium]